MKKVLVLAVMLAAALVLCACAGGSLGVSSDDDGVHAVAKNSAEGSATGNIAIEEGYGLCVNHIVESGSFHVKATTAEGAVVFDEDITDNIADFVDVEPGEYNLVISAKNATGTIDVIAYDKEAQAQADATLDDALEQATGKNAEELGLAKSSEASGAK